MNLALCWYLAAKQKLQNAQYFVIPRLAGVVSTESAHLMNDGIEGVAIALKGRVSCKVEGPVKKGDILVTGPNSRNSYSITA